jgi:hypothetical protein
VLIASHLLAAAGREGENASWTEKNSGAAEAET